MKRYERMTKEEIIEVFDRSGGCNACRYKGDCTGELNSCYKQNVNYLNKEIKVKTVSRWQIIKSDEDLKKMREDFRKICNGGKCDDCFFVGGTVDCFVGYLNGKIEVEDDDE